jgi:large subunit ribosomal protein L5
MPTESLKKIFQKKVAPQLAKEFGLKNIMAVPRLKKVVVNMGIGEASQDKGLLVKPMENLAVITGQKPRVARARISEAGFRLRAGAPIGLVTTLRGQKMYDFLEKLFNIILPRLRDFQGLSLKGFDGQGNYSLGIQEYAVFPEVDHAKVDKLRGLQVTIVTSSNEDQQAKQLLARLGMPFKKPQPKAKPTVAKKTKTKSKK